MSHSRNDTSDRTAAALRPYLELSRMMKQGRSWSGHERNCCFLNTGERRYANVSATSGLDFDDDARAVALVDWDLDGDLDLWVSNRNAPRLRFLRSMTRDEVDGAEPRSHFLALRLVGNGQTTNRDAIGARVEVFAAGDGIQRVKTLRAGEGFLAQSTKWLHFGLGDAETVEKVVVRWPSAAVGGEVEEFAGLAVDRRYELRQGSSEARAWTPDRPEVQLEPSAPALPAPSGQARIPLVTLLAVPDLGYTEADSDGRLAPRPGHGRPVLINLWASWCAPCLAELKELTDRAAEIRAAGLDVMALAVDGLEGDRSDPERARAAAAAMRFPFFSAPARLRVLRMLQHLHNSLLPLHRPLPLPSSFLVDSAGRLAVIYKGRLSVDDVLADLTHSELPALERWVRAAPLGGRAIDAAGVRAAATISEVKVRFQFASDLFEAAELEAAADHYRTLLELKPDFAEARNNLGLLYTRLGDPDAAAREFERVIAESPGLAQAWYNLGIVFERRGDLNGAASRYAKALSLKPAYPNGHNTLGVVYAKLGKMDAAAREFEAATRLDPDDAEAHNNLGRVFLLRDELLEAEARFERAIELDPSFAEAHNNLGLALRRAGRLDAAVAAYGRALAIHPDFAAAHNNLGTALLRQSKLREARDHFEHALRLEPNYAAAEQNLQRVRARLESER